MTAVVVAILAAHDLALAALLTHAAHRGVLTIRRPAQRANTPKGEQ